MSFWWRWLGLWLFMGAGLRGWFLLAYPQSAEPPTFTSFAYGLVNDLQAFVLVAGVAALLGIYSKVALRWSTALLVAVSLIVLFAEVFFWLEFESRLDRLVFHYLAYPKEVLVFLQEQFYLTAILLPFLGVCWLVLKLLDWPMSQEPNKMGLLALVAASVVTMVFAVPLGQSNFRVDSEFASNGYLGVLVAARYAEDDIPWLSKPAMGASGELPLTAGSGTPDIALKSALGSKRHVVLIIEESFAGPVWRQSELRRKFLPNFTQLSEESVSFSNMFATGSRTTRGMEALLNGFPPLPGISTTERTGFERLPSLARGMSDGGFYPVFLYGGWPGFSNFTNYWRSAGFEKIWSREDFEEEFETSWGVSDGALLDRLVTEMNELTQAHEQVFLATLTVSHHRPYDYPAGAIPFPAHERRSEYAMAYADDALGRFMQAAKKQTWYEDTLFIVVADHGPHPKGDTLIPVDSYRIPMLFHGHDIKPRVMAGLSSSMSLARTLMSVFEIETPEAFSGENLLCDCDTVVPVEYGYHIGVLRRDELWVMQRHGRPLKWKFDIGQDQLALIESVPDKVESGLTQNTMLRIFGEAYRRFYAN